MKWFAMIFSSMTLSCAVPALHPLISDVRSYCKDKMDCVDGNGDDVKACIVGIQNERRWARQYGCQGEYRDFTDCLKDDAECAGGYWDTEDCGDEGEDYLECLDDESDLRWN